MSRPPGLGRESGAASVVSRYPRSSATEISRLIERTAKNAIVSGTIRLNISASRYASTVSSCWMPNACFRPSG